MAPKDKKKEERNCTLQKSNPTEERNKIKVINPVISRNSLRDMLSENYF